MQLGQLPDGATCLSFARVVTGTSTSWHEPPPTHVIAMGCEISHADELVYSDGIDRGGAITRIGLSCRLCDWRECRSRAFPPLDHRLSPDVNRRSAAPMITATRGRSWYSTLGMLDDLPGILSVLPTTSGSRARR